MTINTIKQKEKIYKRIYKTRTEFIFGANKTDEQTAMAIWLKDLKHFKYPDINKIIENVKKRLCVSNKSVLNENNAVHLKL